MVLKNAITGEVVHGTIVDEQQIDDKKYLVVNPDNRPASRLMFAKDAWNIMKGK